jgi:hypothetical protein
LLRTALDGAATAPRAAGALEHGAARQREGPAHRPRDGRRLWDGCAQIGSSGGSGGYHQAGARHLLGMAAMWPTSDRSRPGAPGGAMRPAPAIRQGVDSSGRAHCSPIKGRAQDHGRPEYEKRAAQRLQMGSAGRLHGPCWAHRGSTGSQVATQLHDIPRPNPTLSAAL